MLKNLLNIKSKKKINKIENEKQKINNKPWNYTKIESKNTFGIVERDDNLPGYLGKVDLSLYYYDITDEKNKIPEKFKAPHWEPVTRADLKKSYNINNISNGNIDNNNIKEENKNVENIDNNINETFKNNPDNEENDKKIMEELADNITKDIFDYFNQEFIFGLVTKSQIATEFNFEPEELTKLKFTSKGDFIKILENFHTDLYNRMNYEELKKCLLSKINENNNNINTLDNKLKNNIINTPNKNNINIDINNNIKSLSENKNEYSQKLFDHIYDNNTINEIKEENNENIEENNPNDNEDIYNGENVNENDYENEENEEISEDEGDYEDYLPVYNTKNLIIDYDTTQKRLEETNKLLYKLEGQPASTTDMEEDSLEIKIDLDVDKDNPKEVNYNDYKKVLNKYSDKNAINFTIPKPFTFQEDTKSKINGVKKLQKFLITRKENEDKIINDKFKANHLKTEMFIGNINNIMEADKNAKKKRIEKGMIKLQEQMCPFSFVPEDEEKQKIKI